MALRERPLHWNIGSRVKAENMSRSQKVEDVVSFTLMLLLIAGASVYEFRMLWYLRVELATPVWQLLISGALTAAAFVAVGVIIFDDETPQPSEPRVPTSG